MTNHALTILLASATLMTVAPPAMSDSASADAAGDSKMISILDTAPPAYYGLKRYPKFYGDPNMDRTTIDGGLLQRQYLLGSLGGVRDTWAENGFVIDLGVTQAVQGVAAGDGDGDTYYGSADLWLAFDSGRAGLWPGGLIFAHAEGNWGQLVEGTGALLPLNFDTTMPSADPPKFALSELYIFQGLPHGFAVAAGKVNWSAFADKSLFANDEHNQFLHTGLNNNALLGSFVPYTSLGAGIFKQASEELSLGFVITSNSTNALSAGFDDFSSDEMTFGFAGSWTPTIGGKPGIYDLLAGYSNKDVLAFDVDERYLIGEIIGEVPIAEKDGNYALTIGASQYLQVDPQARRHDGLPVGFGPFFRFGAVPKDRNVIDQFWSLGIGGYGGLFGRNNDNWGLGWAGAHISSDLRRDASVLTIDIDSFEHAVEGFYNIGFTPALKLSLHAQYIDSANPEKDEALVLATRLQADF